MGVATVRGLALFLALLIALASHAFAYQQPSRTQLREVLVFYEGDEGLDALRAAGCSVERPFERFGVALAECPSAGVERLRLAGLRVEPNGNVSVSVGSLKVLGPYVAGGPEQEVPSLWSWAVSRVSADLVWRYLGEDGLGAVVAVLDTGLDPSHPLLQERLIGWAEFDAKGRPVCSSPHDTHGHGTWVSSVIAGGTPDTPFGVAPGARLLVALVLPYGRGTFAQVLAGLEWALEPYDTCTKVRLNVTPDVVNMSFGAPGNYSSVLLPAIARLIERGIVPVAAVGNEGPYSSSNPGNVWGVIGVGATGFDNEVAPFSSYEEVEWPEPPERWPFKEEYPKAYHKPDVVAPGVSVPGAFPGGLLAIGDGTSGSAAVVSGIAALVSANLRARGLSGPRLVEAVYDALTLTAEAEGQPGEGRGLVDAFLSVARSMGLSVSRLRVYPLTQPVTPTGGLTVAIEGLTAGAQADIYVSGALVYSGPLWGRRATVEVPPTHGYGNTLTVVSQAASAYGRGLVVVEPVLLAEEECVWGKPCELAVSGVGIGDFLVAYLEDHILTLLQADLRGTARGRILTPVVEEGVYELTVLDLSDPRVRLEAGLRVIEPRRIELVLSASVKPYYTADTVDHIDVAVEGGRVVSASVSYASGVSVEVLNVTQVNAGLYRVWLSFGEVTGEGIAVVGVLAEALGSSLRYPVVVRVVPPEQREGEGVNATTPPSGLEEVVRDPEMGLNESLASLNETLKAVERAAERALGLSYAALAASVAALAIAGYALRTRGKRGHLHEVQGTPEGARQRPGG